MGLGLLANDESLYWISQSPAQGYYSGYDGVGPDGEPADGADLRGAQLFDQQLRSYSQPFGVQRHPLAVEIMVAALSRSEDEISLEVGFFHQELAEPV